MGVWPRRSRPTAKSRTKVSVPLRVASDMLVMRIRSDFTTACFPILFRALAPKAGNGRGSAALAHSAQRRPVAHLAAHRTAAEEFQQHRPAESIRDEKRPH